MFKYFFHQRIFLIILILQIIFWSIYLINESINMNYSRSHDTQMRMSVIKTLGGPCIPIIAQCCTSRNISEGIYARRSDLPGGYCFHSDCDLINTRKLHKEKYYKISLSKKKRIVSQ